MPINVDIPDSFMDVEKQLFDIKSVIVNKDIPGYLKAEQARGFPDEYTLFVKSRGRTSKRKLETVRPTYLRIPFEFRFVAAGNMADVVAAVRFALTQARARAPARSGKYKGSIKIWSNNGTSIGTPADKIPQDTIFGIGPNTVYDAIIEWGFYSGYYKTGSRPDGIIYNAAKLTQRKFGDRVSVRFLYAGGSPTIEIGAAERFAESFRRPGSDRSSARRRKARGIRTRRSSNRRF